MRNPLVFPAIVASLVSGPAFAQATSGGQVPQASAAIGNTSPYGSANTGTQYLQQQQIGNLPQQKNVKTSSDKLGKARPATKDELTPGAIVNDKTGAALAKIEEVDADGVVVSMGTSKVKVPAEAFGHNKAGLLLDMTKAQFEQVVAQAK